MEIIDLYDENRNKIGNTIRNDSKNVENKKFRLVVHAVIFNSKGEMLIQKRSNKKSLWPNLWDISVGGVALSGETSSEAVVREVREELGIELNGDFRPIITHNFTFGFDDFYVFTKDIELNSIKYDRNEVQDLRWANKEDIFIKIDNREFINFEKKFIDLLFYFKDNINIIK